jgi:hypothetical protein
MLRAGCDILDDVLVPNGFHFELRDATLIANPAA